MDNYNTKYLQRRRFIESNRIHIFKKLNNNKLEYYILNQYDFKYYDGVKLVEASANDIITSCINIHTTYEEHSLRPKINKIRTIKRGNSISHAQPFLLPI